MAIFLDITDGSFAIWSNPVDGQTYEGRCIGVGRTLDEAKADAISELNGEITAVEALSDDGDDRGEDE